MISTYVFGILLGFMAPILHAGANILDSNLANKLLQRVESLLVFLAVLNAAFLPIIYIFDTPRFLPLRILGIVAVIAAIEIGYQFPYFWALRRLDTSVVASLFSLGKLLIPFLAFALVGERLAPTQYLGFCTILLGSVLLTFDFRKLRLDHGLWGMLLVSSGLSLQSVLYKYVFESGAGWGSVVVWSTVLELVFVIPFILTRNSRIDLRRVMSNIQGVAPTILASQALTWLGSVAGTYALTLIPVSVINGIDGMQAIFVILLSLILSKVLPNQRLADHVTRRSLLEKSILILLTAAGAWLVSVK